MIFFSLFVYPFIHYLYSLVVRVTRKVKLSNLTLKQTAINTHIYTNGQFRVAG